MAYNHPKNYMTEVKNEAKQEEEQTPSEQPQADEKNDSQEVVDQQPNGEDEKVELSKKEFETLTKKADDFEKSIELKRLNKLSQKEGEEPKNDDEVITKVQALEEKLSSIESKSFNSNLSEAYRLFVGENPWINDDAKFDKIKSNFVTTGEETKEELLSKFKSAAQVTFPTEYEQHLEDRIKSRVMSEKIQTPEGGGANSATTIHTDDKPKTEEDLRKERLGGLLRQNMTWIKK